MSSRRGTWNDPRIVDDPRIDHENSLVRKVAMMLHNNESMHMHENISDPICVYCALRTSRVLRWAQYAALGAELEGDTPWGLIRSES